MGEVIKIWDILRRRYPASEYALMKEVSNAAGFARSNSADFIAVSLWPSRGLAVNGIEVKSYRSDWLREMKKPDKAESIFQYCDYFWLLTTDGTIAKIEEIPETWGWLAIVNNKIIIKKDAPKLTPVPLSKGFVCAMLKLAENKDGFIHLDSIQDKIDAAKEEAILYNNREHKRKIEKADELISIVSDFEKSSGLRFGNWGPYKPEKIGSAVKFINEGGTESIKKDLDRLKIIADNICEKINSVLNDL